ncbi:MAG: Gfo/Idh/MocA family oxidoreductase [Anaerolineae bacterium]|nr:Gfo/Idh/MocA family oxidoreductase [Anaerolineae bacterium]
MVKVGIIGSGRMANDVHCPSLVASGRASLEAVCDLDRARAQAAADRFGIRQMYTNYHDLLERSGVEAVYVVVSPLEVASIVLDCLAAGKHVFLEKPPGANLAETRALAAAAERAGCLSMVGFNRRHCPVLVRARDLVEERGPTNVCLAEFHKNLRTPHYGMSTLVSDVIHSVDWLHWSGGSFSRVSSVVRSFDSTWQNSFHALIEFENAGVGILTANRSSGARYERFELHGRRISAYVRAPEVVEIWLDDARQPMVYTDRDLTGGTDTRVTYGFQAETEHFLRCIESGQQPDSSLQRVVGTMELVWQIGQYQEEWRDPTLEGTDS